MAFTWAQKKAALQEIIGKHYADTLLNAGFVSYKDEGFHWYKLKNDLLYKVHLWVESPASPVWLRVGYGVIPLFTWEPIAPSRPMRDWPWELMNGGDHYQDTWYKKIPERMIGKLPREAYSQPNISYFLPNGVNVAHLLTERCGAEVLDEMVLPVLETLRTPEDVYRFNKENKLYYYQCETEEAFIEKVLQNAALGRGLRLSLTFDDECLFFRDEKLYPVVYQHASAFKGGCLPSATKAEEADMAFWREHARILTSTLETGDLSIFDAEATRVREKMMAQIKKKLPNLKLEA